MSDELKNLKALSMFYPKTRNGLILDYPELEKIEVFRKLNKHDLLFVWYFACESSPFYKEEDLKVKTENALIEAYGINAADSLRSKFLAGNFSDKIRDGIAEMQKFKIGPRVKAKIMTEKAMNNYYELIDTDVNTAFKDKDHEEDFVKRKSYVDATAKIIASLPTLISQAERGFGLTEKEEGEAIVMDSESLIEEFHSSED